MCIFACACSYDNSKACGRTHAGKILTLFVSTRYGWQRFRCTTLEILRPFAAAKASINKCVGRYVGMNVYLCSSATARCLVAVAIVGLYICYCYCCVLYCSFWSIEELCAILPPCESVCVRLCVDIAVKPIASLDFFTFIYFFFIFIIFRIQVLWLSMLPLLQQGYMDTSTLINISSGDARIGQHVNLT